GGNWLWLLVLFLAVMVIYAGLPTSRGTIYWSEFYGLVLNDQVKELVQYGDTYQGEVKKDAALGAALQKKMPNNKFSVERMGPDDAPFQQLLDKKIKESLERKNKNKEDEADLAVYARPTYAWVSPLVLFILLPAVLILALFLIFLPRI